MKWVNEMNECQRNKICFFYLLLLGKGNKIWVLIRSEVNKHYTSWTTAAAWIIKTMVRFMGCVKRIPKTIKKTHAIKGQEK